MSARDCSDRASARGDHPVPSRGNDHKENMKSKKKKKKEKVSSHPGRTNPSAGGPSQTAAEFSAEKLTVVWSSGGWMGGAPFDILIGIIIKSRT